jgi:hypothetical protein
MIVPESLLKSFTIQDTTAPTWSAAATALNTTVECSNAELATAQTASATDCRCYCYQISIE